MKRLIKILLVPVRTAMYVPVVLHELGHAAAGMALGYPVRGVEIGSFPHRAVKFGKFTLWLGPFPRGGRTRLGFTSRTFSRWRRSAFVLGGLGFELLFFGVLLCWSRKHVLLQGLIGILYLDQLGVNLIPKYENGRPVNDGGTLAEILFPRQAVKNQLKAQR